MRWRGSSGWALPVLIQHKLVSSVIINRVSMIVGEIFILRPYKANLCLRLFSMNHDLAFRLLRHFCTTPCDNEIWFRPLPYKVIFGLDLCVVHLFKLVPGSSVILKFKNLAYEVHWSWFHVGRNGLANPPQWSTGNDQQRAQIKDAWEYFHSISMRLADIGTNLGEGTERLIFCWIIKARWSDH